MENLGIGKLVAVPLLLAVAMHLWLIVRIRAVVPRMGGIIRSRWDLLAVRDLINLSMQLAVFYMALYVIYILVLVALVAGGLPFFQAVAALFLFGVITLPLGLWSKHDENMIKNLTTDPIDPELEAKFHRWLEEWRQPKFKLSQ